MDLALLSSLVLTMSQSRRSFLSQTGQWLEIVQASLQAQLKAQVEAETVDKSQGGKVASASSENQARSKPSTGTKLTKIAEGENGTRE